MSSIEIKLISVQTAFFIDKKLEQDTFALATDFKKKIDTLDIGATKVGFGPAITITVQGLDQKLFLFSLKVESSKYFIDIKFSERRIDAIYVINDAHTNTAALSDIEKKLINVFDAISSCLGNRYKFIRLGNVGSFMIKEEFPEKIFDLMRMPSAFNSSVINMTSVKEETIDNFKVKILHAMGKAVYATTDKQNITNFAIQKDISTPPSGDGSFDESECKRFLSSCFRKFESNTVKSDIGL